MSLTLIPATEESLSMHGVGKEMHFGGGVAIFAHTIRAGTYLGQHSHAHDHLSVLVSGKVRLWIDAEPQEPIEGYKTLLIKAGQQHGVEALTDTVWLCIWPEET